MKCMPIVLGLLVALFMVNVVQAQAQPQPKRPNIVFIFADDMGYADASFVGLTDFYETPNIDALAKRGMVFNQAYAAAANCAPSRACLLSGAYTPRHGVYAVGNTDRGPKNQMRMVPIPNRNDLNPDIVTFAEAMRGAGYHTGMVGKWHLSDKDRSPATMPPAQGFDEYFDPREGNANKGDNPDGDPKGMFTITKWACDFVDRNKDADKPFILYVSHHAIHSRWEARPETIARFRAKKPGAKHFAVDYAACLADFDENIGTLVNHLKDAGVDRNTVIIFTSDNGGVPRSSQEPLRGNKGGYYEGGIREPFIAVWPGVIEPGSLNSTPVINVDLYPTFLDIGGASAPAGATLDGVSLVPLFQGKPIADRSIFWHFPGYLNEPVNRGRDPVFRTRPTTVIRRGDWKLHLYHEEWQLDGGRDSIATSRAVELYNLADDESERHDLAQSNPAKRDELLNQLLAWMKSTNAKVPTDKNPRYTANATTRPSNSRGGADD